MDDSKLDRLLTEIYGEEMTPSDTLVQKTREAAAGQGTPVKLIGLSVLLNLVLTMGSILLIISANCGFVTKALLFVLLSGALNLITVLVLANRAKIIEFFNQSCFVDISSKTQGGLL